MKEHNYVYIRAKLVARLPTDTPSTRIGPASSENKIYFFILQNFKIFVILCIINVFYLGELCGVAHLNRNFIRIVPLI